MRKFTRRIFLQSTAAGMANPLLFAAGKGDLQIGITDWNMNLAANPDAVPLAARLGFAGVQVSLGRHVSEGKLPLDDPELIARYISLAKRNRITIDGTCVDRLHDDGLKNSELAAKWVADSIRLTRMLETNVLLVPFFGRQALQTKDEMDHVGDVLRELAPEAERADVILGLEDTISAEDNVRIMERSHSSAVKVYYDVGNSTKGGFDVVKEIRWLGKDRICQFHLKDNPYYLGEGKIQFPPIIRAIEDIGFRGFANLETDVPKDNLEAGLRRNLQYIRNLIQRT